MARTACYIDGFNLYHALDALANPGLKWLNLWALGESFLRAGDTLTSVCYFTAVHHRDPDKARRHRRYIEALRAVGVEVIESKFQTVDKYCRRNTRSCPFLEEKQTDVALATRFLLDGLEGSMDRAVLVTADSDHVPVVRLMLAKRPAVALTLAPPPGRLHQARELRALIADRREISEGRLMTCLLPRTVHRPDGRVAATCPADYCG